MMKKPRQTWYAILCRGRVCGVMASYNSIELEPGQVLHSATVVMARTGQNCLQKFVLQDGVPCENLTVEALLSEPIPKKGE